MFNRNKDVWKEIYDLKKRLDGIEDKSIKELKDENYRLSDYISRSSITNIPRMTSDNGNISIDVYSAREIVMRKEIYDLKKRLDGIEDKSIKELKDENYRLSDYISRSSITNIPRMTSDNGNISIGVYSAREIVMLLMDYLDVYPTVKNGKHIIVKNKKSK